MQILINCLGWGLGTCIVSNKLSGDAEVPVHVPHSEYQSFRQFGHVVTNFCINILGDFLTMTA